MKKPMHVLALIAALVLAGTAYAATEEAENLGKKIGSSWVETLKQVVAMLNDKPAAADARAMLTDMKNSMAPATLVASAIFAALVLSEMVVATVVLVALPETFTYSLVLSA